MASVKKIKGKTGTAFKITVTTGRDALGKQKRYYKTFTPPEGLTGKQAEKAAKQEAAKFEKEIELGYHLTAEQTFEEYALYVVDLKRREGVAESTLDGYEDRMQRIIPVFGHMKLQDIRPQHLNNFYQELGKPGARTELYTAKLKVDFYELLQSRGLTKTTFMKECRVSWETMNTICEGGHILKKTAEHIANAFGMRVLDLFHIERNFDVLSPATIIRYHQFFSVVFSQAEKEMLISYNPAKRATLPKVEHKPPNYFQTETLSRIMDALEEEDIMHRTMVHLFIVTGCRRGEIAGLKWEKIDLENRKIKIDTCLYYTTKNGISEGPTKTRNTRVITIPEETANLLREYRAWYMERQMMNGDGWNPENFLFTKADGFPFTPSTINSWLGWFSKRHGLPHINPHAFRHTAASVMISSGIDVLTVSKMLGHSNTTTTLNVYSHEIEEAKAKASECIADAILRKKAK